MGSTTSTKHHHSTRAPNIWKTNRTRDLDSRVPRVFSFVTITRDSKQGRGTGLDMKSISSPRYALFQFFFLYLYYLMISAETKDHDSDDEWLQRPPWHSTTTEGLGWAGDSKQGQGLRQFVSCILGTFFLHFLSFCFY
jgi:hypothetical protein